MEDIILMKYDVAVDHYHYDQPFAYYKNGDLYLTNAKVLNIDTTATLKAIKEYVKPEMTSIDYYHEVLNKRDAIDNAYDYWFILFTYQAIGGGSILWQNIESGWENELCRRGKHFCSQCGTKTHMHYKPFCPNCGDVELVRGNPTLFHIIIKLGFENRIDYHKYLDAFNTVADDYSNDSFVYAYLPQEDSKYCTKEDIKLLKHIDNIYPLDKHVFWVSW